jgi:4-hydroxyphenylpyruvate dioxygenase
MRRAIATVCLSGVLNEKLTAAAAAGFDAVELFENDLITSFWGPERIRERADDLGLAIDLYQPFRDLEAVAPEVFMRNLRRAEHTFDLMQRLGTGLVLMCANVGADAIDDDDLAAEQLHAVAARAGERGLRVCYEALAWSRHVNDYRRSWRIVDLADHPSLGVCLDSFHILSRGHDPAAIEDIPAEKVFFLQLADAPVLAMDVLSWSRHYRCFPGQGDFDLTGFTRHVLTAGYDGPLSLEVFNDVFRRSDARRTARDAMRSLLALEDSLAEATGADRDDARLGPDVQLSRTPAAGEPSGMAFVELAVNDLSGPPTEAVLSSLGFVHTRDHVSKPVSLWQQGDASVLLNRNASRSAGDVVVSAFALETPDPELSRARAEHLLSERLPREKGPDEADLTAVAAPDGTSIFFARTASGTDGWLGDFIAPATGTDTPGQGTPDVGSARASARHVTSIDHLDLPQPFDSFDEAALFYRCVIGLQPQQSFELPATYGLVRSRVLTTTDRGVRLALSVALLGTGGSSRTEPEPQHVAFACSDVLGAARDLTTSGAQRLEIPDNYYDDLDARLAVDPQLLAQLRELGVLYDRTGTGEYLQLVTPLVGGRLFFELVQRIDGYDAYAAGNAPVRISAHRGVTMRRQPRPPGSRR